MAKAVIIRFTFLHRPCEGSQPHNRFPSEFFKCGPSLNSDAHSMGGLPLQTNALATPPSIPIKSTFYLQMHFKSLLFQWDKTQEKIVFQLSSRICI